MSHLQHIIPHKHTNMTRICHNLPCSWHQMFPHTHTTSQWNAFLRL